MVERQELLARVASMYYEQDRKQAEIARTVGLSRSTVSRILQEARKSGVVEITVHYPWKRVANLEKRLTDQFRLRAARVLQSRARPDIDIVRGLGVLAARYLEGVMFPGAVLGISWGVAVYSTVCALNPSPSLAVTVVQMVGAIGEGNPLIDGPELARVMAGLWGGESRYLHAPLIVEDASVCRVLMQEPRIADTLRLSRSADIALVGIGTPDANVSSLLRAGYIATNDLSELRGRGVVGDVCARQYDIEGNLVDLDLNRRIVGIDLADLHRIGHVIGVAGGEAKAAAIVGAVQGGHINVLVTDDLTASKALSLSESKGV